ncbi:hypothetical protein C8J56DRAFT_928114 [Mycena floridula]|nr:hypothetical protein C8J56DRAFT_928114 [Mycena floridula]
MIKRSSLLSLLPRPSPRMFSSSYFNQYLPRYSDATLLESFLDRESYVDPSALWTHETVDNDFDADSVWKVSRRSSEPFTYLPAGDLSEQSSLDELAWSNVSSPDTNCSELSSSPSTPSVISFHEIEPEAAPSSPEMFSNILDSSLNSTIGLEDSAPPSTTAELLDTEVQHELPASLSLFLFSFPSSKEERSVSPQLEAKQTSGPRGLRVPRTILPAPSSSFTPERVLRDRVSKSSSSSSSKGKRAALVLEHPVEPSSTRLSSKRSLSPRESDCSSTKRRRIQVSTSVEVTTEPSVNTWSTRPSRAAKEKVVDYKLEEDLEFDDDASSMELDDYEEDDESNEQDYLDSMKEASRRSRNKGRRTACTWEGCNYTFSRDHDEKRHVATVHGAKMECPICRKVLSRVDSLTRHQGTNACAKYLATHNKPRL